MATLVNKDSYLQNLAKRICAQESREPRKRTFGNSLGDKDTQPKKKQKKIKKRGGMKDKKGATQFSRAPVAKPSQKPALATPVESRASKSTSNEGEVNGDPKGSGAGAHTAQGPGRADNSAILPGLLHRPKRPANPRLLASPQLLATTPVLDHFAASAPLQRPGDLQLWPCGSPSLLHPASPAPCSLPLEAPEAPEGKGTKGSFFGLDLLRQRLHEKIEEISGQGSHKDLSPAALKKRQRRKFAKEKKKMQRKALIKEKMEKKKIKEEVATAEVSVPEGQKNETKTQLVFNKVELDEEMVLNKAEKKKEKRKALKGNITPLTGKNYKQLLSRLEARKSKLEELKDKDEAKAKEMELKMKWTNALYKAEGIKIRDDEDRLKSALKRKEKHKAQRQKQWENRTEHVAEKMQQRQEKRRKNLQKKKVAKVEKKKAKARKKGRILPGDLEKAGFK